MDLRFIREAQVLRISGIVALRVAAPRRERRLLLHLMRVLIIGSGGREHALAWKLRQEEPGLEILAAPGNPGIAQIGECVPIRVTDVEALEALARDRAVDLTVVGPEVSLAAGVA